MKYLEQEKSHKMGKKWMMENNIHGGDLTLSTTLIGSPTYQKYVNTSLAKWKSVQPQDEYTGKFLSHSKSRTDSKGSRRYFETYGAFVQADLMLPNSTAIKKRLLYQVHSLNLA